MIGSVENDSIVSIHALKRPALGLAADDLPISARGDPDEPKNQPKNEELLCFRAEAVALMGVTEKKD